jgi:hypothetical protein
VPNYHSDTRRVGSTSLVVVLALVLVLPACVSVQKSGEPESAPPPPPTTSVNFQSDPGSAEVYVNGQFRGTTPVNLHLAAGTHKVELRLAGYRGWERDLVVVAGDDTRVAARLQPE